MRQELCAAVRVHKYLCESVLVDKSDRAFLSRIADDMSDIEAQTSLRRLCRALHAHWGVRPIVLLDEYDTPMQEAWLRSYWEGMSDFVRALFNSTFKTNPDLGRGLITGITRVASESIFSDLNNPSVVTVTTPAYQDAFGLTRREVVSALDEFGVLELLPDVERWYDGYSFGGVDGIYNPWSVTNFLARQRIDTYWADSSSNALVSDFVRRGGADLKADFELLLAGDTVERRVDERVDFRSLGRSPGAVWSLLLATGYLRVVGETRGEPPRALVLALTNREVQSCLDQLVGGWFDDEDDSYNAFCRALLAGDVDAMTDYLADLAYAVMSSFDSGTRPSRNLPERFWHGLVLGLIVGLRGRYTVESNRESGYGRYDVALVPTDKASGADPAIVLEFKVQDVRRGEKSLEDAVNAALAQIAERRYVDGLVARGIAPVRIRAYGIAFCGKDVLVGEATR